MWRVAGSRAQQRGLRIGELDRGVGFQPAFVAGELSDRLEAYPTGAEHHRIERGTGQSEMVEADVEEPVVQLENLDRLRRAFGDGADGWPGLERFAKPRWDTRTDSIESGCFLRQ